MRTFIGIPDSGVTGDGSSGSPFGLADLLVPARANAPTTAGAALTQPGDTLLLRRGLYPAALIGGYDTAALRPAASGTAEAPITIRSYPGEIATLVRTAGLQPLVGSSDGGRSYITIKGLDLRADGGTGRLAQHYGNGTGNRIDYCTILGQNLNTLDNNEAVEINGGPSTPSIPQTTFQTDATISFCDISGSKSGSFNSTNSCGIKTYFTLNMTVEDCLLRDCQAGIYFKVMNHTVIHPGGANIAVRRCYFDRNLAMPVNYGEHDVTVEDCIFRSRSNQPSAEQQRFTVRNCLHILGVGGVTPDTNCWHYTPGVPPWPVQNSYHDNVVLGSTTMNITHTNAAPLGTPGGPDCLYSDIDHNLYARNDSTAAPSIRHVFGATSYTLAQMQALGLDLGSQNVPGGPDALFSDPANFIIKAPYDTAGRGGGKPGPDDPASILDISRYGASALVERERQRALVLVRRGGAGCRWLLVA